MRARYLLCICALALLLAAAPPRDAEPDYEFEAAVKALRDAGVGEDEPSLLRFFRDRTPAQAERDRLQRLTRVLGDDSFEVRQKASRDLIAAGRSAVPFLRAARRDPDLEVVRRAEECLQAIETSGDLVLTSAAARVLAQRKPPGTASVLLAYLPNCVEEEDVWQAVLQTLAEVGPDPATVAALADKDPARRAAAGFVLGKTDPSLRRRVRQLLSAPEPLVRFQSARGLLLGGDREAVPALAALTGEKDGELAWRAEDLLFRISGDSGPMLAAAGDEEGRKKRRAAWEAWWKENGADIDLARVDWQDGYQGLTVVCDCDVGGVSQKGRVWACSRDGKVRWEVNGVANPADVQLLPGGRVLVAECYGGRVITERDRRGKVLWQRKLDDDAVNCQRLPGGNTFIASYTEVLEVMPGGKVLYSHKIPHRTTCALKLRNGHILYAASDGLLREMTTAWKEVRSISVGNLASWAGIEVLPGGRYLLAQYGANQVIEIDTSGKVLWKLNVRTPAWASRLRNGNTLVCSPDGHFVAEFDRDGREVWKRESFGRPFRVRRQ